MKKILSKLLVITLTLAMVIGVTPKEAHAASWFYKAPQITKQPEDFMGNYGDKVEFSVKAAGSWGLRLRYQWYYQKAGANTWKELPNAAKATVSYTFDESMDGIFVGCTVYDGLTVSRSKIVSVNRIPQEPEVTPDEPEIPESPEEPETPPVIEPQEPVTPENPDAGIPEDQLPDDTIIEDVELENPSDNDPIGGVADEPSVDEPVVEDPDEPVVDEPVVDGPDDPSVDEPVVEEPEDPSEDEPVVEEPEEPAEDEPAVDEPAQPELPADYVTPEMYGAKGDGVTDDSTAIQRAVNSGKDVVLSSDKTYFIAANKYITLQNKNGFRMIGGNIHKAASSSNYNMFVLYGCTNCSFENMFIYSEMTATDTLVPSGHRRPTGVNSNVLAFSGVSNSNIRFINNRFENMNSDYWFNGRAGEGWSDITVDGWVSSSSMNAMYAQYITNLTVRNATVEINPTYAGEGDHCIYVNRSSNGINISSSNFTWNGTRNRTGTIALLTFHGGEAAAGTMPRNVRVSGCSIAAGQGKAFYCGEGVDVSVDGCTINNAASASLTNLPVISGYGTFNISNSSVTSYDTVFDQVTNLNLDNCDITGGASLGIFAFTPNLKAINTRINMSGGVLYFVNQAAGTNHTFIGCTINKSTRGLGYIISRRSAGGTFTFDNCNVNCGGGQFMYNGGVDFTGLTITNSRITNCSSLGNASEMKNYSISNTYVNDKLFR